MHQRQVGQRAHQHVNVHRPGAHNFQQNKAHGGHDEQMQGVKTITEVNEGNAHGQSVAVPQAVDGDGRVETLPVNHRQQQSNKLRGEKVHLVQGQVDGRRQTLQQGAALVFLEHYSLEPHHRTGQFT